MKKRFGILAITLFAVTLVGCNSTRAGSSLSSAAGTSSSATPISSASSSTEDGDIHNADLSLGATTYQDAKGVTHQLNRSSIYRSAGAPHVDSYHSATQKPHKLLVAPISFTKDATDPKDTITADDALLEKIRIAFAGTSEETKKVGGYVSVQDFYKASSFGHGGFDVVVLPTWINYGKTPSEFKASSSEGGVTAAEFVRTWYLAEYAKDQHGSLGTDAEPFTDFDTDGDGYVDLIWNVYAYPYIDTSFWWAYVTYTGNAPDTTTPTIKTLAFASTNFMSGYNGYDSHTFIHETGHTLGLDDYYDYTNTWAPMAGVDYMDHNLGDHNSYSKFSLGWVNPWVLKEEDLANNKSAVITLRAATTSGDSLVLASPDYNGTAFDEYLMVELVGPYGLCKADYTAGYQNTTGFTQPGIRILHIDARAYAKNHDSYLTSAEAIGETATDLRLGNTYGGRIGVKVDSDYWTLDDAKKTKRYYAHASMIESTIGDTTWETVSTYNATNDSLFHVNSRFSLAAKYPWAKAYMPSESNLWNKAKTITSWSGTTQNFTVDESKTCNYYVKVLSIDADATYGAVAKVKVMLNA
jgi:M6 family metalloprotease-like protein